MANKFWCVSTSHPLVIQISEKYNLSKRDARTILNSAKRDNPALQGDDVTMDFLEQQDSFKSALNDYTQKIIDTENAMFQNAPGVRKETSDFQEDLRDELELEYTEEQVEEKMNRYTELARHAKTSKVSASNIASILRAFPDTRRLEFLGNWVCQFMSELMTDVETDAELREILGVPKKEKRIDYYRDSRVTTALRKRIISVLLDTKSDLEADGKVQLASEIDALIRNFDTLMFMYGGRIFRTEGVQVNISGNLIASNEDNDSPARNEIGEDEDGEPDDPEQNLTSQFSASDQNKSISTKIVPTIKTLLNNLRDVDGQLDEKEDPYGYGLWSYVSPSLATNKLLSICRGCQTYSEMVQAMERNRRAVPWINQLLNLLDTESSTDESGEVEVSQSRKEQLQSMFFKSFRKQFTHLRSSYMSHDENGNMIFVNTSANVNTSAERMMNKVERTFKKHTGIKIFKNNVFDYTVKNGVVTGSVFKTIDEALSPKGRNKADSVFSQMQIAGQLARQIASDASMQGKKANFKDAFNALSQAEEHLRTILKEYFGIEVSSVTMNNYLSNTRDEVDMNSFYSGYADYGDKDFVIRYRNLQKLLQSTTALNKAFMDWTNAIAKGESTDNPFTNPLVRKKGNSDYAKIRYIRNWYENVIAQITEFNPDTFESRARINSKDYYSWNNPSTVQTIVESLTTGGQQKIKDYIMRKYGKDAVWFMTQDSTSAHPHFYSQWLEDLYYGRAQDLFDYSEKPSFCKTDYNAQSDVSYALNVLNDFFFIDRKKTDRAYYRMLIASDKPRYSSIRYKRYHDTSTNELGEPTDKNYHSIIANQAVNFFGQELRRSIEVVRHAVSGRGFTVNDYDIDRKKHKELLAKIKRGERITREDVVINGRYIFRNTGASFYLNKFINDEIEQGSELGQYVIDRIFNYKRFSSTDKLVDDSIIPVFKEGFHSYMQSIKADYSEHLKEIGMYQEKEIRDEEGNVTLHLQYLLGPMLQWSDEKEGDVDRFRNIMYARREEAIALAKEELPWFDEKKNANLIPYFCERVAWDDMLEEFIYNNWMAKSNMSEIFDVDLAFYKDTTNFQKRNAQVVSSGYVTDPEAKIHGKKVSDGKYRSITIKTTKEESTHIANLKVALEASAAEIKDKTTREQFLKNINITLDKLGGLDPTDGQAFTSLTALRKRRAGQGEWSRSDSEELDKTGYTEDDNGNRTYIYTDEAVYWRMKRGEPRVEDFLHVYSQPQKPFMYSFVNVERAGRGTITIPVQHKNSEYALIYMAAYMQHKEPDSVIAGIAKFMEETADADITYGIDTANFDSAVKIGGTSEAIDLSGKTGQEVYEALKKAVWGEAPEIDSKKRKVYKPGVVTEYDNTDYKLVQEKPEHFKDSSQPMGTQLKILAINNIPADAVCTLPDGKTISGKELRDRYMKALRRKMRSAEADFDREFGLKMPRSGRLHKLSVALKEAMSTDQKFTVEMRRALSITERNGEEQFVIPLDDPSMQSAIEAMLYSKMRRVYYKEKTKGGIVVQATSWGASEDLSIRFYSSNPEDEKRGGVVPTLAEFEKEHNYGSQTKKKYEQYLKQYQKGYAYFEMEAPMPNHVRKMIANRDGSIDKKYFNKDGSWNMEEIKKVVPEKYFDGIAYRTPTEAKYSMMVCKIVRFSPESAGSVAKFPKDLTEFTGSDFDIDTDTIEIRPEDGDKNAEVDNELFDLQLAALRSNPAALETFKPGDFSDLSELSYYITLLDKGWPKTELDKMSFKELKDACSQAEDLDLMNPWSDIILHNQNSDAKDMIAIGAVGVTSHAFISLYNDQDIHENTTRVVFKEATKKSVGESFIVINDKNGDDVTKEISGDVTLDAMYDMDGDLISTQISKYVGASADAAKDAAEYRLNINKRTLPILITMHRLGISSDVARLFIAHPVIREVTKKLNSASAFGYSSIESACEDVRRDLMDNMTAEEIDDAEKRWTDVKYNPNLTLRYSDLLASIIDSKSEGLEDKFKMLHILTVLSKKADAIRNLDSFTRYNSGNAMRGSTFLDRYSRRQNLIRLQNNLGGENPIILLPENIEIADGYEDSNYGKLCSMFPYIAQTIHGEEELTDKIILENMHTYNPAFFEAMKIVSPSNNGDIDANVDVLKSLYAGWKNYLLFVGDNRIADFTDEATVKYYTRDYAMVYSETLDRIEREHPEVYKAVIEGNTFIDSIGFVQSGAGYLDFDLLSTNINGMSDTVLEQYKRDWEALLHYPETRQLAIDTSIHFLARAAAFSRDTPVHVMPLAIKEAIPGYIDAFNNADKVSITEDQFLQFIVSFYLNNVDDSRVVPHLYFNSRNPNMEYNEEEGLLTINKRSVRSLTDWFETDKDNKLKLRIPVICINMNGEDLPFIVDGSQEITKEKIGDEEFLQIHCMPVSRLGIPNKIMEYTGLDMTQSIFSEDGEPLPAPEDIPIQPPFVSSTPLIDEDAIFRAGRKTGTYVDSPLYDENVPQFDHLAKNERDNENNPYLETRTFLKRAKKIIGLFDFNITSTGRSLFNGESEGYSINLAPTKYNIDQHRKALQVASLVETLGINWGYTTVTTYCSPEDANEIEFSFRVDTSKMEEINKLLPNNHNDRIQVKEHGVIQILVDVEDGIGVTKVEETFKAMKSAGLTKDQQIEVNYVKFDYADEKYLNEIEDENTEQESDETNVDGESTIQNGQKVRVSDLVRLAKRKANGEKVDSEIRTIFNERRTPLRNTAVSKVSSILAQSISFDSDTYNEIADVIHDSFSGRSEREMLDNLIVNTANWIMGNHSEEQLTEMLQRSGLATSAGSIITTIKKKLEELDIC